MNPYKTLNISQTATIAEIKQAYKNLAKEYHPDKGGDTIAMQQINEAYEILTNPAKFKEYTDLQEKKFSDFIEMLLFGIIEHKNIAHTDIIDEIRVQISANYNKLLDAKKQSEKTLKKLQNIKDRIISATDKNVFAEILDKRIALFTQNLIDFETEIDFLNECKVKISEYQDC